MWGSVLFYDPRAMLDLATGCLFRKNFLGCRLLGITSVKDAPLTSAPWRSCQEITRSCCLLVFLWGPVRRIIGTWYTGQFELGTHYHLCYRLFNLCCPLAIVLPPPTELLSILVVGDCNREKGRPWMLLRAAGGA